MGVLSKIKSAGFNVSLVGENLAISPASDLTQNQKEFLRSNKAEIIQELKRLTLSAADQQKLLDYMALIDETDESVIDALLTKCSQDTEALAWALSWADKLLLVNISPKTQTVTCRNCSHFKSFNTHGGGAGRCGIGVWTAGYNRWSDDAHQCGSYKVKSQAI